MKLAEILNEKLQAFTFIKQSLKELMMTMSKNVLILDQFYSGNKEYYVLNTSKTRQPLIDSSDRCVAIIQLNGDKLNAAVKSKNVEVYLNDKNKAVSDDLYTDERMIRDAVKFIEQVSVLIVGEDIVPVKDLKELETMCSEMNVPLYFYKTQKDLINNNRQNKVKLVNPDYNYNRKNRAEIPESIKAFIYFYDNSGLKDIPDKYTKYMNELVLDQKRSSFVNRLTKDIKGISENPLGNQKMGEIFQKEGTENLEVIVKKIAEKWKDIINLPKQKQAK